MAGLLRTGGLAGEDDWLSALADLGKDAGVLAREHKLILIIGFSLFLVVAVLISDHMSQARSARLAEANEVVSPLPSQPIALLRDTTVPRSLPDDEPEATVRSPESSGLDWPSNERRGLIPDEPTHIGNGPGASKIEGVAGGAGTGTSRIDPDAWRAWIPGAGSVDQARGSDAVSEREALRVGEPRIVEPVVPAPRREPEPAVPLEYIVQPNDSLYRIAERFFGDGIRWRDIAAFNEGKVADNGGVRTGVRLLIPPEGVVVRADTSRPSAPKAQTRPEPSVSSPRSYVVQKGDTLGQIASKLLGSSRRAGEIVKLNSDKIDDADEIYVGMKLSIPPK